MRTIGFGIFIILASCLPVLSMTGSVGRTAVSSGTRTASVDSSGRISVDVVTVSTTAFYSADSGLVNAALASSDNGILFVVNPATSTKTMKLQSRFLGVDDNIVRASYRLYLNSFVSSSGTLTTSVKLRGSSSPNSSISVYTLPTVTGTGTRIDSLVNQSQVPVIINDDRLLWLYPGQSWLMTANPSANNKIMNFSIKWIEE